MNYPIKTNKLEVVFNYEKIDERYDIFEIKTSENYYKKNTYIFDNSSLNDSVLSVCYTFGPCFYIMLKAKEDNKQKIQTIINHSNESDFLTFSQKPSSKVYKNVLTQLLLNASKMPNNSSLKYNNLSGHLYVFRPNWIKRKKWNGESIISQIPCLDISIDKDLKVHLQIKTFTSLKLKKLMAIHNEDVRELPKYTLAYGNTLKRKLNDDEDTFIIRQFANKKNEIAFLDVSNYESFLDSKLGVLEQVIENFNIKYAEIASLSLETINDYKSKEYTRKNSKENDNIIFRILKSKNIKIVDYINDVYSETFVQNIIDLFKKKYDVTPRRGKRVSNNSLNICVIHNKEYYGGVNDPHDKVYNNAAVQHITLEDFSDHAESAISTIVHEIIIKEDLKQKRISIFDWESLGYNGVVSFGISVELSQAEKFFFMNINPDGTFSIEEQKLDLFNTSNYNDCISIFSDYKRAFERVKGVVKDSNGNINIIRDTNQFTIPEIENLSEQLKNGNTYLRNQKSRDEFIAACTEIRYFENDGNGYYFSGIIGNGMRAKVSNACNIRKIEPYNSSELFFDQLLSLMSVPFVRNKQLTVIPFPFKYLREYINNFEKL